MDFRQPNATPVTHSPMTTPSITASPSQQTTGKSNNGSINDPRWLRILSVALLFGIAVILALMAILFANVNKSNETQYIDTSKYQAVFLSNGQVYFGKMVDLNDKLIVLDQIYYLTQPSSASSSSSTTDSSNYTLVKLGCQQIHDPVDQMVINRDQITFWENLNNSGKVVQSIQQYVKQNPKGPDCSQVTSQTQSSATATQGTSTTTNQTK